MVVVNVCMVRLIMLVVLLVIRRLVIIRMRIPAMVRLIRLIRKRI